MLGAFVMTYNRPAALASTLKSLFAQTMPPDTVLVVDNAASPVTRGVISEMDEQKIEYTSTPENLGPAGAAAAGLRNMADRGFDWIYWGDDDDPPKTVDTLARLRVLIGTLDDKVGAVGAVGTRWNWQAGRTERLHDDELHGPIEVDVIAGSSQFIVSRNAIGDIGLPNAQLFFGFEEAEFCLRMRRVGYRLMIDGDLAHQYRKAANRLNLPRRCAWRPMVAAGQSWRQYYSTRNYIYTMCNTFGRPDLARRETSKAIGRCVTAWSHGIGYGREFVGFQLLGVMDGYRGRMGRTVQPQSKREAG